MAALDPGGQPDPLVDGLFTVTTSGVILRVQAQPGARRSEVVGRHGDALKVRVVAPADRGRANAALVAVVAGLFDVAPSAVEVIAGHTSRVKRMRIAGVDGPTAARVLARALAT